METDPGGGWVAGTDMVEATAMAGTLAAPTSLVADAEAGCVRAERALRALTRR